jgi:hypothetical protein
MVRPNTAVADDVRNEYRFHQSAVSVLWIQRATGGRRSTEVRGRLFTLELPPVPLNVGGKASARYLTTESHPISVTTAVMVGGDSARMAVLAHRRRACRSRENFTLQQRDSACRALARHALALTQSSPESKIKRLKEKITDLWFFEPSLSVKRHKVIDRSWRRDGLASRRGVEII